MKIPFTFLALFSLGLAPDVIALPAGTVQTAAEAPVLRPSFDAAVEVLRAKVAAGTAIGADYVMVADEFKTAAASYDLPDTDVYLGTRILERIAELETTAQLAMYRLLELDILHDQAIDAELEYALAHLKAILSVRQPTNADWEAIVASLTARADAAQAWNPEIDAIIGRLRTEIDALIAKAKSGPLGSEDLTAAIAVNKQVRLSVVLARLEKRSLFGKPIEADYLDVADIAKRLPVPPTHLAEFIAKVEARLDEIRAAVRSGRITREQFADLHDLLMFRARCGYTKQ